MFKHVAPADPAATILDPARGRDLPPEGAPCAWCAYWAGLQARGDVVVSEIPEAAPEPAPEAPPAEPAPETEG